MSFEFNKIAAAVLVAGLIAMITGMVGKYVMYPHDLEKPAYVIEGVEADAGAGAAAPAEDKGPEPIEKLLATADVNAGKDVAKKCLQCHKLEKGAPNAIGPNLWGVVMANQAHHEGFAYSKAFTELKGQWTYADLNHYLYNPRKHVPGTKMSFAGLPKTQDRANLIAYLRTLSDNPAPLP